jgi:hypothetical protein
MNLSPGRFKFHFFTIIAPQNSILTNTDARLTRGFKEVFSKGEAGTQPTGNTKGSRNFHICNSIKFVYLSACQQQVTCNGEALKLYITEARLRPELQRYVDQTLILGNKII